MLHLHSSTTYYWYNGAADMRKGFDALCGMVQQNRQSNILQGGVYIFVNRKRNQIKLLTWEGDGLAIYYKRLEKGVYELPSITPGDIYATIDTVQLQRKPPTNTILFKWIDNLSFAKSKTYAKQKRAT